MAGHGYLQLFVHGAPVARAGQRVVDGQQLQAVALIAGAEGEDEAEHAGHHAGDQERDHLVVTLEHAARHQQCVSDQADQHHAGRQQRLAGRDHEEVEENQRVDPEQAVDAQVDGDQRGAE